MNFQTLIKNSRLKVNLSQEEAADKLGYTRNGFIWAWENGRSFPPIPALRKMSKLYHVPFNELASSYCNAKLEVLRDKIMGEIEKHDNG